MSSNSLYHYTNIDAVTSIIQDKQLMLTNINYLNDSQELIEGLELLKESLPIILNGLKVKNEQYKTALVSRILHELTLMENQHQDTLPGVFTCSFSKARDDLSQWRAYGNYAIKFDLNMISNAAGERTASSSNGAPFVELQECVYDGPAKAMAGKEIIGWMLAGLPNDVVAEKLDVKFYSYYLLASAAIFKNKAFNQEKELRIISSFHHWDSSSEWQIHNKDINFKFPRNGYLIPRYSLDIPLTAIKEIQVGPMPDQLLAKKSLSHFVDQQISLYRAANKFTESDFPHKIKVTVSDAPFKN